MFDFNIDTMTLEQKIGQLIVFGFDALDINDHVINLIKNYQAGNVILFARNIKSPEQLFKLNQNLQKLAMETIGIPLLICLDQEGGMVTRIRNGSTYFPGAMTVTASHDAKNAYMTGKIMGQELKALGINWDLAPTLDVNNNPYNPVIGVRSYGDDPMIVSEYGNEMIRGLQENVIATAKHFPGHGDTKVDSHLDLPKIDKTLEELKQVELKPFLTAIDQGVKCIMSAHINFPALTEDGLPTTLSQNCLTGFLRGTLGFQGIITTDCMEMKAIQTYYTTRKGALMAIEAGADIIMISHTEALQVEAIEYIRESVINHELSMGMIDERVKRILQMKSEMIELDFNQTYADVKDLVENKESQAFALDVVRKAVTLVKGKPVKTNCKTLLIASDPIPTTIADEVNGKVNIVKSVNQALPEIDTIEISLRVTDEEIEQLKHLSQEYEQVIFCSYNANMYQKQLDLIRSLNQHRNFYVIAMRNPYDNVFVPEIENLTFMYEYTPNSVQILIEYLKDQLTPIGISPVNS